MAKRQNQRRAVAGASPGRRSPGSLEARQWHLSL